MMGHARHVHVFVGAAACCLLQLQCLALTSPTSIMSLPLLLSLPPSQQYRLLPPLELGRHLRPGKPNTFQWSFPFKKKNDYGGTSNCMFNAGLGHNCDFKDAIGASKESDFWDSASPGKRSMGGWEAGRDRDFTDSSHHQSEEEVPTNRAQKKTLWTRVGKRFAPIPHEPDSAPILVPLGGVVERPLLPRLLYGNSRNEAAAFPFYLEDVESLSRLESQLLAAIDQLLAANSQLGGAAKYDRQSPVSSRQKRAEKGMFTRIGRGVADYK